MIDVILWFLVGAAWTAVAYAAGFKKGLGMKP